MSFNYRKECDLLGEIEVPSHVLYGAHTQRALKNFALTGQPVHRSLIHAYGLVKLACTRANRSIGVWADDATKADAIERASRELAVGSLDEYFILDKLQGGAGTSTNMNVNEVIANRALEILQEPLGNYQRVSPLDDINLHQSTNDTFPTALKLAAILLLRQLENKIIALQEAFQAQEKRYAHVVKIGRTELQDAALITLGREMGAYAEALSRDRWRLYKCEERLRVVNLGGTAIGTGLAAPREYIFRVVDFLREETGVGFARAENLVDATQNADVFVEVSGMLKTCATTLFKICSDLRILSSGPQTGFGEIHLPECQAGSSLMPGKVNPVIPEAVSQMAMQVMANDMSISIACAHGNLELNPFLPLVASALLESCEGLAAACDILGTHCVTGIVADEERCKKDIENSTAMLTALVATLGYEQASNVAIKARKSGRRVREIVIEQGLLTKEQLDELLSPEAVCRLGHKEVVNKKE
ncbi:MAG: aspartate ammonia-lyase [Deltaproteobacteria bacterium]|nr:aspartate ammonia-lyase [Deltaproteobacteria bacterium]